MKLLKKLWWVTLLRGIIFIILSVFIFRHPVEALVGVAIYISISLLFSGLAQTFLSISSRHDAQNWGWGLAGGLVDILFGFILLSNPVITAATLPFMVGFWVIVYGIMTFAGSFQEKKEGVPNWWLGLISGIVLAGIGYILTNNLLAGSFAITFWIGFGFLLAGILNIFISFGIKSIKSKLE